MKTSRFLAFFLCICLVLAAVPALAASYPTQLTMRLSTRTGPSASYTEPGTFFSDWEGVTVNALSKAQGNGVWWVQVEFTYGGQMYRAYTGAKRISLDPSVLPAEETLGVATLSNVSGSGRYGPGNHYASIPDALPAYADGSIIAYENNWVQFDFTDSNTGMKRRVWLPADKLSINWYGGQPSQSTPNYNNPNYNNPNYSNSIYYSGDGTWCELQEHNLPGTYSYMNIHLYGYRHFYNVPVYMQGRTFGYFQHENASGFAAFMGDSLYIEITVPGLCDAVGIYLGK